MTSLADCVIARLLESWEIPHKTNRITYKKFETAETGNSFKMMLPSGKILVFDAPLCHQISVNIQSFFMC